MAGADGSSVHGPAGRGDRRAGDTAGAVKARAELSLRQAGIDDAGRLLAYFADAELTAEPVELLPLIGEAIVGDHGLALMAEADGELKGALVALVGTWFGTRAAYIAAAKSSRAASRPMWHFLCRWAQARRAEGLFASYRGTRLKALHRRWGLEPVAMLLSRRLGDNAQPVREA